MGGPVEAKIAIPEDGQVLAIVTQAILYHGDPREDGAIVVTRHRLPQHTYPVQPFPTLQIELNPPADWDIWPIRAYIALCHDNEKPVVVLPSDVELTVGMHAFAEIEHHWG